MKKFLSYFFLLQGFLFQLAGAHKSKIEYIKNSRGESVLDDFWNEKIKNKVWFESSSSSDNCNGITCFATYDGFAKQARKQFEANGVLPENPNHNSSPRCHSEVFLLCALKEGDVFSVLNGDEISLESYRISIQNESYYPCKTAYGKTYSDVMECNPGITCDEYINQFALDNKCQIIVKYPKKGSPCYYPR